MVVLDTNIIIDHLRQNGSVATELMKIAEKVIKENMAISVITIQELYEGKSTKDKNKEDFLLATINPLRVLPYNYEIAQLAGEIARDISRPIELADATIAATAIVNGAELATLNTKDFIGIKDLAIYGNERWLRG